ncbi:flagellar protein FlaG [Cohnella lupini]|uniref:Flagellar protein FlaG n=1 Tax=Cohnella lupini TaxID=1294267 RepID=A0A3D9I780_9BACL|nr:flagellar protein FlaG [Cohnella lupini]RED57602.1 flagellar protein FlaG [Cohnella lupini]
MNLQNVSSASSTPIQNPSVKVSAEVETLKLQQNSSSQSLRTGKQLDTAEKQGMKISIGEEQLIKAVDRAIKSLEGPTTTFEVKVHEQTKAVMVKVFNKETGELIREIPPEKTLDLVVKMMEFAGILVDEKV